MNESPSFWESLIQMTKNIIQRKAPEPNSENDFSFDHNSRNDIILEPNPSNIGSFSHLGLNQLSESNFNPTSGFRKSTGHFESSNNTTENLGFRYKCLQELKKQEHDPSSINAKNINSQSLSKLNRNQNSEIINSLPLNLLRSHSNSLVDPYSTTQKSYINQQDATPFNRNNNDIHNLKHSKYLTTDNINFQEIDQLKNKNSKEQYKNRGNNLKNSLNIENQQIESIKNNLSDSKDNNLEKINIQNEFVIRNHNETSDSEQEEDVSSNRRSSNSSSHVTTISSVSPESVPSQLEVMDIDDNTYNNTNFINQISHSIKRSNDLQNNSSEEFYPDKINNIDVSSIQEFNSSELNQPQDNTNGSNNLYIQKPNKKIGIELLFDDKIIQEKDQDFLNSKKNRKRKLSLIATEKMKLRRIQKRNSLNSRIDNEKFTESISQFFPNNKVQLLSFDEFKKCKKHMNNENEINCEDCLILNSKENQEIDNISTDKFYYKLIYNRVITTPYRHNNPHYYIQTYAKIHPDLKFLKLKTSILQSISLEHSDNGVKSNCMTTDVSISHKPEFAPIIQIAMSHDGRILASVTSNGVIRLWDISAQVNEDQILPIKLLIELRDLSKENRLETLQEYYCVAFSPDDMTLFVGGKMKSRYKWDSLDSDNSILPCPLLVYNISNQIELVKNEKLTKPDLILEGHTEEILCLTTTWSENQFYILTGSYDGSVIRWRLSNTLDALEEKNTLQDSQSNIVFNIEFIPDTFNRFFITASDNAIRLYDLHRMQLLKTFETAYTSYCDFIRFLPQSTNDILRNLLSKNKNCKSYYFISHGVESSRNGKLDANNKAILYEVILDFKNHSLQIEEIRRFEDESYSSNAWLIQPGIIDNYVFIPGSNGKIYIFNVITGQLEISSKIHYGQIRQILPDKYRNRYYTCGDDGEINVFLYKSLIE